MEHEEITILDSAIVAVLGKKVDHNDMESVNMNYQKLLDICQLYHEGKLLAEGIM